MPDSAFDLCASAERNMWLARELCARVCARDELQRNTYRVRLEEVGVVDHIRVPDYPHKVVRYEGQKEVLVDCDSSAVEAPVVLQTRQLRAFGFGGWDGRVGTLGLCQWHSVFACTLELARVKHDSSWQQRSRESRLQPARHCERGEGAAHLLERYENYQRN